MGCRPIATILVSPSILIREGLAHILNPADFRVVGLVESQQNIVPAMPHDAIEDAWRSNGRDELRRLTDRERSILRYLVEGDSNKIIGRKIGISEATVKVHVKAILRKIRVRNRTQAAIWATNKSLYIGTNNCTAAPVASQVLRRDALALAAVAPAVRLSHPSIATVKEISGLQQKSPSEDSC
jgi:DNA-binding CsgD family transcriptional regulator